MNPLAERIAAAIEREGPISIAQFMTMCLYDAEHGAYAARAPIGANGDYITAPEVSQTFGEMCGLWIVQTWHNQGRPQNPLIVELGPGRGTLMKDALRAIRAAAPKFLPQAEVKLVEISPAFKEMQTKTLAEASANIAWVSRFDDIVVDRPVYLIANEFFDCLPIRQYVKTATGWCEKVVAVENGALALALAKLPLPPALPGADVAPEGAVLETCSAAEAVIEDIARTVVGNGGAALLFDYGYDAPSFKDSLQAVARHKHADALSAPGASDLSAHVDFAALARAAEKGGAAVFGPRGQGDLLVDLGIEVRVQKLAFANPNQAKSIVAGVRRLIDPKEMGDLFRAIALVPPGSPNPPGFD
jgi:NADH dehydrogenase [ubiquinone] 1 alpha subcomplex assembly factor 7